MKNKLTERQGHIKIKNRMCPCFISPRGFTLVEIIVAALLLALISAGMFSITLSSRKLTKRSAQRHFATEVAQAVLENLRAYLGDDYWPNGTDTNPLAIHPGYYPYFNFSDDSSPLKSAISDAFGSSEFATRFNARWSYKVEPGGDNTEYRKVTVDVQWDEIEL